MSTSSTLDSIAERYVKAALGVGLHDPDYVDAYYGPAEWKAGVEREKPGLKELARQAASAHDHLLACDPGDDDLLALRHDYLARQLHSMAARIDMLAGKRFSFDEESRHLYDAVAPTHTAAHFQTLVDELGGVLPGSGPVPERFDGFKRGFIIPKERLDTVFTAAIAEARERSRRRIPLPSHESFELEYVTGKSWSGYNWYRGSANSLIQINTDLPIYIDRAIDLASHEGYPGHHVYNALIEAKLVRGAGFPEFSVYALYSPQSLIAEGTANHGIEMAFPGPERVEFERAVLFPLAGLNPSRAEHYYAVHALFLRLNYAGNEAARRYLDGAISREEAIDWLVQYALMSPDRARQRTAFFDAYRSYVINYNLGQDMVRAYIERVAGSDESARWKAFERLLSTPQTPSGLAGGVE